MKRHGLIPHDALVLVGDGQKAMFLRNKGDEKFQHLVVERVFAADNPPTHDQGADRPGRAFQSAANPRRSSVDNTDWHEEQKHRFAREVADALEERVRARETPAVILVAPARTLAALRDRLGSDVKTRVVAELDKDLTKHPVADIERQLADEVA